MRLLLAISLAFIMSGCATQYSKGYYAGVGDTEIVCSRAVEKASRRGRLQGYILKQSKSNPGLKTIISKPALPTEE